MKEPHSLKITAISDFSVSLLLALLFNAYCIAVAVSSTTTVLAAGFIDAVIGVISVGIIVVNYFVVRGFPTVLVSEFRWDNLLLENNQFLPAAFLP